MTRRKSLESLSIYDSMCLKGIAIWLMMFHHCYCSIDRFENYIIDFRPFTLQLVVDVSNYFKICVSIFAFITGYGLYLSAKNGCDNVKSTEKWIYERLMKTLNGFWFIYILVFLFAQIYARYPESIYFTKGMFRGIIYILIDFLGLARLFSTPTMVATWWYMSAAIVFIILVPVFIKWTRKVGFTTLFFIIMILPRCIGDGYPGGTGIFSFLSPLLLGMLFAQYDIFSRLDSINIAGFVKNRMINKICQFAIYSFLLVASIIVWIKLPRNVIWEYHFGIAPIIAICYCRKYIIRIPVVQQFLWFCGKHSMNIFLVHTFIRFVFFEDFIYGFRYFWLIAIVLFFISMGISVVIELLKKGIHFSKIVYFLSEKYIS